MEKLIALALAAMALVVVLLALKASVIALITSFHYARPQFCRTVYRAYTQRPKWSFTVGAVNSLVAIVLTLILLNIKPLGLVGIGLATTLCAIHLAGRSAYYQQMCERLSSDGSEGVGTIGAWILGAVVGELRFLVPVIGQLIFIVITLRAAGACIIALISSARSIEPNEGGNAQAGM